MVDGRGGRDFLGDEAEPTYRLYAQLPVSQDLPARAIVEAPVSARINAALVLIGCWSAI